MPTDRTRLPLPDEFLMHPTQGECYTLNQLREYSDAECAPLMEEIEALRQDGSKLTAENAALRAELEEWRFTNRVDELDRHVTRLSERVKVLGDALQRYVNHDLLTGTRGKMNEIARAALGATK